MTAYGSLLRAALAALLVLCSTARAQLGLGGELDLSVESVGVGDRARAGEWTGVRLRVTNPGETRELVLRIETRDADGDRPQYERVVTANTNVPQSVWVYVRVPFPTQEMSTLYRVSAYEAVEASESRSGYRAGRLVAQTPLVFTQGQLFQNIGSPSVIGFIGSRTVGLERYRVTEQGEAYPPTMHERTELVQLREDELPDRWLGLEMLDTIVWTGGQPQSVRPESARALREWIERGGHFVVVLPSAGQEWYTRLNNELFELMPAASPRRLEDVDLEAFRPLLAGVGTESEVRLPSRAVVHVFDPAPEAQPGEAVRVLNGPDGRCVVVRRVLGAGAVTVVGIDLLHSFLTAQALPRADVFWNRVLGRRGLTPTPAELTDLREGDMSRRAYRGSLWMDDEVLSGEIAERGQSAKGVLLGFVLFGVYWAVAGPVGFAVLKRTKKTHHAWVMFLASIGLFTAVAWGGATLIRPKRVSANHLTMITHVYGQDVQRARSWLSLMVPSYGRATLSVGEPDPESGASARRRFHQSTAPWESRKITAFGRAFPDARGYPIDSAQPDAVSFPARQTVKQFRVDWAGLTPWGGMPRPVGASPEPKLEWATRDGLSAHRVVGTLVHELPGPLEDVVVIVNRQQTTLGGRGSNNLLADAMAVKLRGAWAQEVPLDLSPITRSRSEGGTGGVEPLTKYLDDSLTPKTSSVGAVVGLGVEDSLRALALYPLLEPAPPREGQGSAAAVVRRAETHGVDVGRWLTQPCVIVLGEVRETSGTAPPIPLYVNGRAVEARGRTMVMWVYPLPDDPPRYPAGE